METFRGKRSKVTGYVDRSSGDKVVSALPARLEGKGQVQKQRNFPKLASDSSSSSSDTSDEDSFTLELEWRSSKRTAGTPIKNLLAQEMSRESEVKRRSPSVIARLMGLDGLPPQQSANRQRRRSSENYQQRTTSAEKAQRSGTFHGRRSFRKSSLEEQEFKDVFEVLDASKLESSGYSSQRTANSNLTEAEMAFIQQKFMDAKRLSTDEKLQHSKEFHDALEVLDSNKDLLLKFLQQPDSLFTKHLHDLQGALPQSHCGRISALKSSHKSKHDRSGPAKKSERDLSWKSYSKNPHKDQDSPGQPQSRHITNNSLRSSNIPLKEPNESAGLPTRIVVLKPNVGKAQTATRAVSSPRFSHDFRTDCRLSGIRSREAELRGKKKVPENVDFTRQKCREPREIAKEITKQMRSSFSNGSMNFSTSGVRGYAGDESSGDNSGSESANESDVTTVSSRATFNRKNQYRSSSSRSTESYVSREAKKRLSERWKLTHRSQEQGVVSRGSTLGEMLAIPDRDHRTENLDGVIDENELNEKFGRHDGRTGRVQPIGISSSEGWKDGFIGNLSRSRSVPASSDAFESPKTSMHYENVCDDWFMMPTELVKQERSKSVKGDTSHREGFMSRSSRSSSKKPQSSLCTTRECNDSWREIDYSKCQVKSKFKEDDTSELNSIASEIHTSPTSDVDSVTEIAFSLGHEKITVCSEPSNMGLSAPALLNGNLSTSDHDVLRSQEPSGGPSKEDSSHHPVPELQSPASAKESDQPSPVSVLEASFPDDLSSGSECFESLSADLHGLRMQLQLLKLESEAYTEGPMLVSSDDEAGEGSVQFTDEKSTPRDGEDWESLYLADVLTGSGFVHADPETFMAIWHSPECPVSPLVFQELEKKFCDLVSSSRPERRLLFDRINSKLLEIFQHVTDPHPWVRPATRIGPDCWSKNRLKDTLRKLLTIQDKKASKDAADNVVSSESQWLDLGDDIDIIGREIERLLTDELVAEVVAT